MEVSSVLTQDTRKGKMANQGFELALTADFFDGAGQLKYRDIGLELLEADPTIVARPLAEHHAEIGAEQLANVDAALVLAPRVTAQSLERVERLLVVARFGVGYDNVDVAACTAHDVLLCITAGAVDRLVAEATLTWMLALSYRVAIKDRLKARRRWDDRSQFMGSTGPARQDGRHHRHGRHRPRTRVGCWPVSIWLGRWSSMGICPSGSGRRAGRDCGKS